MHTIHYGGPSIEALMRTVMHARLHDQSTRRLLLSEANLQVLVNIPIGWLEYFFSEIDFRQATTLLNIHLSFLIDCKR